MLEIIKAPVPDSERLLLEGAGYKAWSENPAENAGNEIHGSGDVVFRLIPVRGGTVITNIHVFVTTIAATVTACKVGLYDTAAALLASSADLADSWESLGMKTHALSSAFTVPASGVLYVAVFHTATTPVRLKAQALSGNLTEIGTSPRLVSRQTGQTDLPDPATLADYSSATWVAVS